MFKLLPNYENCYIIYKTCVTSEVISFALPFPLVQQIFSLYLAGSIKSFLRGAALVCFGNDACKLQTFESRLEGIDRMLPSCAQLPGRTFLHLFPSAVLSVRQSPCVYDEAFSSDAYLFCCLFE